VTIRGVKLARVFLTISEGTAAQVATTKKRFPAGATLAPGMPLVGEIRIEPIDRDGPDSPRTAGGPGAVNGEPASR
jgi:hypothetical protein